METTKYLDDELKNFIVNVGWTHKIQICQSDIYIEYTKKLKWVKIVLTSLTSVGLGSFLLKISSDFQNISMILTFALSLSMTIVVALDKENDYKELANQNKLAADKFLEIREKALELLYELNMGKDADVIQQEFKELKEVRNQENSMLPHTSLEAVEVASIKIKDKRDNDYSEDYEYFIPKNLRNLED
ncbi:SLATT domain-containing protein [Culicoidibacter larvae]|uniref:SLATT domain-containing protein n=1 Tax=Culicoidibacter larvae TaxID=2579976 RepID=A0A5R8QI43_9FIRM|nr:SLATT domain-containing protein [Culicoidibacter larvae]TLG77360.1 SLATT domain-containing protein [Culicoidibacter larvae]